MTEWLKKTSLILFGIILTTCETLPKKMRVWAHMPLNEFIGLCPMKSTSTFSLVLGLPPLWLPLSDTDLELMLYCALTLPSTVCHALSEPCAFPYTASPVWNSLFPWPTLVAYHSSIHSTNIYWVPTMGQVPRISPHETYIWWCLTPTLPSVAQFKYHH